MDKIKINNQVVSMRKFVKQAKIHSMNKYAKEIKFLQSKKGNENQKLKYERKAQRLLEKIALLKKIQPDYVSKLALSKAKDWASILQQKNAALQDQCLALLANYSAVQSEVEKFHLANSQLVQRIPGLILEWEIKSKNVNSSKKTQSGSNEKVNPKISKEDSFTSDFKQKEPPFLSPVKTILNKKESHQNSLECNFQSEPGSDSGDDNEKDEESNDGTFFIKSNDEITKNKKGTTNSKRNKSGVSSVEGNFKSLLASDSEKETEEDNDDSEEGSETLSLKSNVEFRNNKEKNSMSKIKKSVVSSLKKELKMNKSSQSLLECNFQSGHASDSEEENEDESDDEKEDFFMKTNSAKVLNKVEKGKFKNVNNDEELQNPTSSDQNRDSENDSLNSDMEINDEETESSSEIEEGSLDILQSDGNKSFKKKGEKNVNTKKLKHIKESFYNKTNNDTGSIIESGESDKESADIFETLKNKIFNKQTKNALCSEKFQSGKKGQSKNKSKKVCIEINKDTDPFLSSIKSKKSSYKDIASSKDDIHSRLLKLSEITAEESRKSPEPSLSHKTDPFFIVGDSKNIDVDETTNFNKKDRFTSKNDHDIKNRYNKDQRDRFKEKSLGGRFSKFRHADEIHKFSPKRTAFGNKTHNRSNDSSFKNKKAFENSENNRKPQLKNQKYLKNSRKDGFSNQFNKNKSVETKSNFQPSAKTIGEKSDEPLHPSWQAKRKLKEAVKTRFAGKRIVFDE